MTLRTYREWTASNAASHYLRQAEALLGIAYPLTRSMPGVERIERAGRVLYVTEPWLWRARSASQTQGSNHDTKG